MNIFKRFIFVFLLKVVLLKNFCQCCNYCCNDKDSGSKNYVSVISFNVFSDFETVAKNIFNTLGREISDDINEIILKRKNDLNSVAYLVENKFSYKCKPQEVKFSHIHWNGSITKGIDHYKHLCYMLAPLNCILHLDNIVDFFSEELNHYQYVLLLHHY